ncbi:MAG: hypothetical protein AB1405_06155 [Bdellovibrionota bacterium]
MGRRRAYPLGGVLSLALALWAVVSFAAAPLPDGFKNARWGMTFDELDKAIPGLREDLNRFEPDVTAYHSFQFPNNGFSEFRLFKGRLFYIRIKFTRSENAEQLVGSMRGQYGPPVAEDTEWGAKRTLWADGKTALALIVYPYFSEIRLRSEVVAKDWLARQSKEEDAEKFLDEQIGEAFGSEDLTMQERLKLRELKQTLGPESGQGSPAMPAPTLPAPEQGRAIEVPPAAPSSETSTNPDETAPAEGGETPAAAPGEKPRRRRRRKRPPAEGAAQAPGAGNASEAAPAESAPSTPPAETPPKEKTFEGMDDFLQ